MFLEKRHRFIRHYRFSFVPRRKSGPTLPLVDATGKPSILAALQQAVRRNKAIDVRPNSDVIEMMSIDVHAATGAIVALIHRASPKAADPMYRRKARAALHLRTVNKKPDEEQSVSAHLIILPKAVRNGVYDAILEEIPGLSMSLVQPIIGKVLRDYDYNYKDNRGDDQSTYTVFRPEGVKSESVTNALKTGNFGFITLSRPARAKFIDSEDFFKPVHEKMKIRVKGKVSPKDWAEKIGNLAKSARRAGWEDFQIDIELDDERSRRISIARGEEAKEVLFIRSAEVNTTVDLAVCTDKVVDDFISKAIRAI